MSHTTNCSDREDLRSTTVYLLFGKPETLTDKAKVYIGEAENAYSRLVDHVSKKEFWNEIIVQVDDKLVFKSDWLFSSPSAAANVIMGRSANGLKEWKDSSGKKLHEIEKQEISKANKQIQPTT